MWTLALLVGCPNESVTLTTPMAAVTWSEQVGPVMAQRCVGCHESELAPFRLRTWEEVQPLAALIVAAVDSGSMPPWPFRDDSCRAVPGSIDLTPEERELFLDWRDSGYARGEGEVQAVVPPPAVEPRSPDATFAVPSAFAVDPVESDPYWCGYVSASFLEELWVEGAEIVIDGSAISHHGFLYSVPAAAQPSVDALDAADPLPGFRCDGGFSMTDGVSLLAGWAPGSPPWWPAGSDSPAMRIPAGSRLAVEMHYNTAAIDAVAADTPSWKVWYADGRPSLQIVTLPVADLHLNIPAGSEGWQESATTRLPLDARLSSTGPHMHGLGKGLSTKLTRADGSTVCLSDLDGWDFNWQFSYPAEGDGIPVDITDTITLTCTFDNPTGDAVGWGERTDQEMCLDYLTFLVPSEPKGGEGTCGDFSACFARCVEDDPFCPMTCMAHSGEACLLCGSEAMFGECTLGQCLFPALALDSCTRDCPDLDSDYANCLYTACAAEWTTYEACWRSAFTDGTCAADAEACVGLAP